MLYVLSEIFCFTRDVIGDKTYNIYRVRWGKECCMFTRDVGGLNIVCLSERMGGEAMLYVLPERWV